MLAFVPSIFSVMMQSRRRRAIFGNGLNSSVFIFLVDWRPVDFLRIWSLHGTFTLWDGPRPQQHQIFLFKQSGQRAWLATCVSQFIGLGGFDHPIAEGIIGSNLGI